MIKTLKIFWEEVKIFSKNNWWIYIIFTFCLAIIYKTNTWNLLEISLVFGFHFLWDLFVMIMVYYFSIRDNKNWLIFQILNFFIFFSLALYSSLTSWKFHYLLYQFAFILPSIKGYFELFRNNKLRFLDWKFSVFVNILIILLSYYIWLLNSFSIIIQIVWFSIFSIALILDSRKYKYIISVIWIFSMTIWSGLQVYNSFLLSDIKWIDLSYTLLPLTVLVFHIKSYKKFMR